MAPEALATALVLASAMLHAVVNALVKISDDGLLTRGCMNAVAFLVALPFLMVVSPPDASTWKILIAATLVHGLYPFFLARAYHYSDLSVAFPIARGIAPLGVAALSVLLLNTSVSTDKLVWIGVLCLGVATFALHRSVASELQHWRGLAMAVCTGGVVAIYTLLDGIGLRTAPNPYTYIVWLFILDGIFVSATVTFVRRQTVMPFLRRNWHKGLLGGTLGVLSYSMALYALSLGSIVEVAAMRETSVVFAAVIGAVFLKERFGKERIWATFMVVLAILGLKLSE